MKQKLHNLVLVAAGLVTAVVILGKLRKVKAADCRISNVITRYILGSAVVFISSVRVPLSLPLLILNLDESVCSDAAELERVEVAVDLSTKMSAASLVSPAPSERKHDTAADVQPYECVSTRAQPQGKLSL